VIPGLVGTEFRNHGIDGTAPIRLGSAPPGVQWAAEVAAVIVGVIDNPVAEVYTNPAHAGVAQKYFQDVGAFERSTRAPAS